MEVPIATTNKVIVFQLFFYWKSHQSNYKMEGCLSSQDHTGVVRALHLDFDQILSWMGFTAIVWIIIYMLCIY